MSEKNTQLAKTVQAHSNQAELRIFPFFIAGLICFTIAVLLGSGTWYFFGSNKRGIIETVEALPPAINEDKDKFNANETDSLPNSDKNQVEIPAKTDLTGLAKVFGSEITLGGGDTKLPLERVLVKDFSIAETEVTNAQYAEFIKETNHPEPKGWKNKTFSKETENFPVTNVSFKDAEEFCRWLSKKSGLTVRLPTEAEWELAARGTENNKYPWGNNWESKNIITKETGGKISPVKSFAQNRSPFGAYDMVGNVWEWTQEKIGKSDVVTDESVKDALTKGEILRVVKGGSAQSPMIEISVQARYEIPENTKLPLVGFRYVVEQNAKE